MKMARSAWVAVVLPFCFACAGVAGTAEESAPAEQIQSLSQGGFGNYSASGCVTAVSDAFISEREANTNFGAGSDCRVDGDPLKSCLLKWDLTQLRATGSAGSGNDPIPSNATVLYGEVRVVVIDTAPKNYRGRALLQPWSESEVTWNARTSSANWGSPGANGAGDVGASSLFSFSATLAGTSVAPLTTAGKEQVQSWLSNPSSNNGVYISSADPHLMRIASREAGNAAKLCLFW